MNAQLAVEWMCVSQSITRTLNARESVKQTTEQIVVIEFL